MCYYKFSYFLISFKIRKSLEKKKILIFVSLKIFAPKSNFFTPLCTFQATLGTQNIKNDESIPKWIVYFGANYLE